jgi:hypothetical protein
VLPGPALFKVLLDDGVVLAFWLDVVWFESELDLGAGVETAT